MRVMNPGGLVVGCGSLVIIVFVAVVVGGLVACGSLVSLCGTDPLSYRLVSRAAGVIRCSGCAGGLWWGCLVVGGVGVRFVVCELHSGREHLCGQVF